MNPIAYFFNEVLMTSSDSSSEEEEHIRIATNTRPKVQHFIEDVVDRYSEEEFRENFRMYRTTFNHILILIKDKISSNIYGKGRQTISAKAQLMVTLWYFATPDTYRSICGRFNIGKATGLRSVRRVTIALCEISNNIITWPSGAYIQIINNGFSQMGFPNVIGCIDGTYIPIPLPKDHGVSYICRKNFPCLVLQSVCDHTLKFTHCYAGEVGSTHDANVLKRSEVWTYINRYNEKFPGDVHLLGDIAYPCLPQLITPYKDNGHLTPEQRQFNYVQSHARITIERAFSLLKKRFRCLKNFDVRNLQWIPQYIIACCVLHNICIMQNDILELDMVENRDIEEIDGIDARDANRERLRLGSEKRNRLCREINQMNLHL